MTDLEKMASDLYYVDIGGSSTVDERIMFIIKAFRVVREEALEDAAKVAESQSYDGYCTFDNLIKQITIEIRKLKEEKP